MRRAVGADQPGAVDRKADRQLLDRHVVHDLVVAALQEGRIDRAERLIAFRGQPGREGDRVLLGDADVEDPLGEYAFQAIEPGALGHRGGNGDDFVVAPRRVDQRVGEDPRI